MEREHIKDGTRCWCKDRVVPQQPALFVWPEEKVKDDE